MVAGYDIEQYDSSVLSKRSMAQIAGDEGSAEWTSSRPVSRGKVKAPWLAETLAKLESKSKKTTKDTKVHKGSKTSSKKAVAARSSDEAAVLPGAVRKPMPAVIHPMLATPVEKAFDDPAWLFEIKWDGYRAVSFIEDGKVRLVSRNQNDLTGEFPELHELSEVDQGQECRPRWRDCRARRPRPRLPLA